MRGPPRSGPSSSIRRWPAPRPTSRSSATTRSARARNGASGSRPSRRWWGGTRWRTTTSGWPSGRRATTTRRRASAGWGWGAGGGRGPRGRRRARGTCATSASRRAPEGYGRVLWGEPASAAAWSGVGLVLVELKRFPDARNAFVRAVEADPAHAGAHYNLSFTLSNLGDFDGALRATKRALELDPYYVSQKFQLTIDLQYEKATIGIAPEISADVTAETLGENFAFDERLLDNIFQELQPAPAPEPAPPRVDDPLALARDYVSKGLMDVAAAEAVRAVQRGADRAEAAVLLGDIFARRGLHGEALERYHEARGLAPDRP